MVIKEIIDKLSSLNTLVIFIGNGASMDGKLLNNQQFPSFSQLIVDVLNNAGKNEDKKITLENALDNIGVFAKYIKKDQDNASSYLKKYLNGFPGVSHHHFISLLYSLFDGPDQNFKRLVFVTTNYDNFIEQSLDNTGIKYYSATLPEDKSTEDFVFFSRIEENLKNEVPVILHLFGDLKSESPIFFQKDMLFSDQEEAFLSDLFKSTVISIGYSFSDDSIYRAICSKSNKTHKPLYQVTKKEISNDTELENAREIKNTGLRFSAFVIELLTELYKQAEDSNNRTDNTSILAIRNSYEGMIKKLPFSKVYNEDYLKWRINTINNWSFSRVVSRSSAHNILDLYLEREVVNWHEFLYESDSNLALISGNAGVGKSTYMYMTARVSDDQCYKLLITPNSLMKNGFRSYLEQEFLCPPNQLNAMFQSIDKLLEMSGKKILILVDAINELGEQAVIVKNEIEELFYNKWKCIKLAYSCRTYFWDNILGSDFQDDNYFKTYDMTVFSDSELDIVYPKYKNYFELSGELNDLSLDLKERLKEPLMLRLLAETYQGDVIPKFAPAVKIFNSYLDLVIKRFGKSELKKTIIRIADIYWKVDRKELEGSMSIPDSYLDNLPQSHIQYLKDSNIIYEEHGLVQFHYERFFEFILGLSLINSKRWALSGTSITAKDIYLTWQSCIDNDRPYTYAFSIKSSLIHIGITSNRVQKKIISDKVLINNLINISQTDKSVTASNAQYFKNFIIEVVREYISELTPDVSQQNLLSVRRSAYEELRFNLGDLFYDLVLEIGRDDFSSMPYQIELLVDDDYEIKRQVVFNLLYLCNSMERIDALKEEIIKSLCDCSSESIEALVYLFPVFIKYQELIIDKYNKSVLLYLSDIVTSITSNLPVRASKIRFRSKLIDVCRNIYLKEAHYFFGSGITTYNGIEFCWNMDEEEQERAYTLLDMFSNRPSLTPNRPKQIEVIRFFASEIMHFHNIDSDLDLSGGVKKIRSWEYFMARYILAYSAKSEKGFYNVVKVLDSFIDKNLWLTLDFSLTTMECILRTIQLDNDEVYSYGLDKMKSWIETAEENHQDFFFYRIFSDRALDISFNPLSPVANTIIEKKPEKGFSFLEERIESGDIRKAKLALLSIRKVTRKFPKAGTQSLIVAWSYREEYDSEYKEWLNLFMKELLYVQPRMIQDVLTKVGASQEEKNYIYSIENASPKTNEYNIIPFFQWLMNDRSALDLAKLVYQDLIHSKKDCFFKQIEFRGLFS